MERKVYTEREQIILAMLVKEKGAVIENKKTDGTTLQNRNRAWEEVTKQYNIQPEVNSKRTSQQLRKLWANLKQKKRKETTKIRHEMLATGGGLPDKKMEDPVLSIIDVVAPYADVELNSTWDSTAVFENSTAFHEETKCEEREIAEIETVEPSQGEDVEERIELIIEKPNDRTANTVKYETPVKRRRKCLSGNLVNQKNLAEESALRIKKLKDAINQQDELHKLRMRAAEEELAGARLRKELDEAKLIDYKSKCGVLLHEKGY